MKLKAKWDKSERVQAAPVFACPNYMAMVEDVLEKWKAEGGPEHQTEEDRSEPDKDDSGLEEALPGVESSTRPARMK
jgi:hypothetical protein